MRGDVKITASHLRRVALIYVRQSTIAQVRNNTESTARQYGLVAEATRLGWASSAVEVIDADLGLSGRSMEARSGFKEVVGRVCLGEVGAIFGLEVSRLARSSADLSKLLELARLTDTLVVDADGVYDLADFNDRLLLGLKNTMSEAELHVLAGRMDQAKRAAAARGDLRLALPAGYVHDDDGSIVMDPDSEVQAAVADLFAAFVAAGSAYGVVRAFSGRRFPRRPHGASSELSWAPLSYHRVLKVLANPTYAGAYAFGRHRSRRVVSPDGSLRTRTTTLARSEWETLILDHHPPYITWEQFCLNEARLAANNTNSGARPPREGSALCQGMIHCGGCGRPMGVHYVCDRPSYECTSRFDGVRTAGCRSVTAATVDEPVSRCLLAALSGEEVALALAAADEVADRRARTTRAAELAVERARYQAQRAERALVACEPENRLVARTLEARLEERLTELAEAEAALAAAVSAKAPLPPRAELEAAVTDIAQLWAAPTTTDKDRKRLLRTLVADVTLRADADPAKIRVGIRWRSGATEEVIVARPVPLSEARRTAPDTVAVVRRLGPTTDNATLAELLNEGGHVTGTGRAFDAEAVRVLRRSRGIPAAGLLREDEATVADVSARLEVSRSTVVAWIDEGLLEARRDGFGRYLVLLTPEAEVSCRDRIARSSAIRRPDARPATPHDVSPAEVARRLGISRDAVYGWARQGHVPSRVGAGGRIFIPFTPEVEATCRQRIAASRRLPPHVKAQADNHAQGAAL